MMDVSLALTWLAAAGGGGSSSGGGGEGGIFVLGYFIGHGAVSLLKKKLPVAVAAGVATGLVGIASILAMLIAPFLGIVWLITGAMGVYFGYIGIIGKYMSRAKKAKPAVLQAAQLDPVMWDEETIRAKTAETFVRFQTDWTHKNIAGMKEYLAPHYLAHIHLMIYAMDQMHRSNVMNNLSVNEVLITEAVDSQDNSQDRIKVAFAATATDAIVDTTTNTALEETKHEFAEEWSFVRNGNTWLLEAITPSTQVNYVAHSPIRQFAEQNGLYYSLDWGRILIPNRGQLFNDGAKFRTSDINNHVIGMWEGQHLIQMYTYSPVPAAQAGSIYMVAQINVPKSYGGIIVRRKKFRVGLGVPANYKQVSMEWVDFNKRYEVFAQDENQVTSFELLNPAFMAWLYDQQIPVDIEVVDNVIYLYAKLTKVSDARHYTSMLEILKKSHKELKR